MKLSDFDFFVPEELIAQSPLDRRDSSKMMVLNRRDKSIEHKSFSDLPSYLKNNDTLVFNQSKVIKARVVGNRETGGKVEAFLLRKIHENVFECLVKLTAGKKENIEFTIAEGFSGKILRQVPGSMLYEVEFFISGGALADKLDVHGRVPLPPYIHREPVGSDIERYQTVYASEPGSVAAPTAGLHFTPVMLESIREMGIKTEFVTLHVGLGTFQPIKVDDIEQHQMHREYFSVSEELSRIATGEREKTGRLVAVGTTSVRALESVARGMRDSTDLFLRPGSDFKVVDALFTNFHQPKSSLIVMLAAFVGDRDFLLHAYAEAIQKKYRFFSYGDCMLVL
jgi:S-adenosylmethionine:tRNA ribosyltransferase-isomerase